MLFKKTSALILGVLIKITLIFSFMNCSQPGTIEFIPSERNLSSTNEVLPQSVEYFSDTFVQAELNTAVEFVLSPVSQKKLTGVTVETEISAPKNGNLVAIDHSTLKYKYTPHTGYRGADSASFIGKDIVGNTILFNVKINVANPVQSLKPALAIRGIGCIQCHAKVNSNFITDFGFGDSYYFNQNIGTGSWKSGGVYGDHGQSTKLLNLMSSIKFIVPKAALPASVSTTTNTKTLQEYLSSQLSVSTYEGTKLVKPIEFKKVFIGAPASNDIITAFNMKDDERLKYFKNSEDSGTLSGLVDLGTHFKNETPLVCEGDVAIKGPLLLENLEVNTTNGCRLYVMGSVFIFGTITHIHSDERRNLQITSTESINLGLGLTHKDGVFCEPNSNYARKLTGYDQSSLVTRYLTSWPVPSFSTRAYIDAKTLGTKIISDSKLIETTSGIFMDASCRAEGRSVSFERLLLNAPAIHSRYLGNFIGTIISEYSIMSLGKFKFEYDKVFDKVPVLPMLNHKLYLDLEE